MKILVVATSNHMITDTYCGVWVDSQPPDTEKGHCSIHL